MLKIKNKKGATLLEVIMIIGIVGIMSSITIVSFTAAKLNSELDIATEEVSAILREAQNYSLTGKEVAQDCTNHKVNFTSGSDNLSVGLYEDPTDTNPCGSNITYSLENGIKVDNGGYVNFTAPHGKITTNYALSGSWYAIRVSKNSQQSYICFNAVGLIKKSKNSSCN